MKAFIVGRYGKASGRLSQMPEPELRPGDVLVEIHTAASNSPSIWARRRDLPKYPQPDGEAS
jgi:NADPH:quinone reductase-like Zn-dependent oxidoreductase